MEDPTREETPAERHLRETGGEIVPDMEKDPKAIDMSETAAEVAEASKSSAKQLLEVPEGRGWAGKPKDMPDPFAGYSEEQKGFIDQIDWAVAVEHQIWSRCFHSVREWVNWRLRNDPPDSAELGKAMFGPGERTPLEKAEPYIAIEFYRAVRRTMEEYRRPGWAPRLWAWLRGLLRRKDAREEEEQPRGSPEERDGEEADKGAA